MKKGGSGLFLRVYKNTTKDEHTTTDEDDVTALKAILQPFLKGASGLV